MPGERRPHRWAGGSSAGSSASPSSSRRTNSAASSPGSRTQQQQGQQGQRWGSSLSTQRRERTVVWASCLQKVQALRQGGSWQRAENGGTPSAAAAAAAAAAVAAAVSPADDGLLADGGRASGDRAGAGTAAFPARHEQQDGAELNEQLDILARLTYPNSSISPQDAGFMISALCEAVPRSSRQLSAKVAQLFELLCAKQQRVSFLAWQLNIVLDLFVASLPRAAAEVQVAPPPPPAPVEENSPPPPRPPRPLSGQRDCTRALAQLLYENGERLGTRFDDVVPPLLRLADPSAIDLDTRHAALDALANLCLKNWAGFAEPQRQATCSCLTRNFVAHWRAFASSSSHSTATTAAAVSRATPGGGGGGGGGPGERKILASATRGLACAIGKAGVSPVLEPYLARVVHALNHLVQPAGAGERSAAATAAAATRGASARGSSRSTSGSRSRSRNGRGFGEYGGGAGDVSPTRSSASASLADPRARVRLQALALLESMAAKDAKSMYPHWALFFAPYVPGAVSGGGGACGGNAAAATPGEASEGGGASTRPVVLPAGLVSIMESGDAPQVRAAAAGAAAALVKGSPLRKWMMLAAATGGGGGGGGGGIGERVESMMLRLHQSLVLCLAQEKSPAVVSKLCSCTCALIAEMPYATSQAASGAPPQPQPPRGGGSSSSARRGSRRGGGGGNSGGGGGVEESLGDLLRALARLMVDVAAEPSARIAASQALTAVFSAKEPVAAIDSFLLSFRCSAAAGSPSSFGGSWGGSRVTPPPSSPASAARRGNGGNAVAGSGAWSPLPLRPGSADDRGNRFVGGGARNGGAKQQQQQHHQQDKQPSPPGERASGGGGGGDSSNSSRSSGSGGTGGADVGGRAGGGLRASDRGGARASDQMPRPLPREATVDDDTAPAAAATAAAPAGLKAVPEGANGRGDDGGGDSFVDRLISLAGAPGQLRAEALGLLTRIGRSYPAHLSGGGGGGARGTVAETTTTTWERVSALLLRCFADPDQNLRLHALKVLEALLLARAEQSAAAAAAETLPAAGEKSSGTAGGAAPAAESVSKPRSETAAAAGGLSAEGVEGAGMSQGTPISNVAERRGVVGSSGTAATGGGGGGGGGKVWRDLVQKHLQRALEDPYHGVRAVACSCHASLLKSDWEAFSDRERDRCLGRVLAATRDRAAGVNILACRVVAGVMTMAGQEGAAAWCRDPEFLDRCAARLQEMMEDTKATIRAQAMLAVGNLSCSLHGIRSRRRSLPPSTPSSSSSPITSCAQQPPPPEGTRDCRVSPAVGTGAGTGDLIPRPRLRALCDGALRLTATEPDHAAGSAVRALGYLAWGLDPDNFDGGADGWGGKNGVLETRGRDNESAASLLPVGGDEDDAVVSGPTVEVAVAAGRRPVQERGGGVFGESGEEDGVDRDLQDKAILALSTRLAPDKKGDLELGNDGAGGGGGAWGGGGSGGGDRRAEIAGAKCRWNCCIALGVVLSARGVQARAARAWWAPVFVRSLRRAVLDDNHLKVRTHAAHALKAVLDARAYGDQLPSILGGCLRGLAACKSRSVVADPTQMRYAGDLEVALRSLVLHILIALVALGDDASSSADCSGGGATAALLGEYADELLEVLSSPESDAALRPSELSPYYRPRRHRRLPIEDFQLVARDIPQQDGRNQQDEGALGEGMTSASFQPMEPQQRPGGPSPRLITEAVLAATAEGLACLLGGGGGGGGGGGNGARGNGEEGVVAGSSGCGGRGGGGEEVATELSSSLVSKQTWAACVAEAGRRRLRVDRLLGGGKNSTCSSSEGGVVWEAGGGPGRVRVVTAAMAEGGGGGGRREEEEDEEEEEEEEL